MHLKEVKFKLFIILMVMFYDIAFNENNKEIIKSLISLNFFQGKSGVCHTCRFPSFRLHACLYCVYFGCYTTKHIHEHAFSKNHNLGTCFSLSLSHNYMLEFNKHYCFYNEWSVIILNSQLLT